MVVTVILVIVLVGGLALVAVTSGEVGFAGGYRSREAARTCADAAVEHSRAILPDTTAISRSAGNGLTYMTGHLGTTSATATATDVPAESVDFSSVLEGENVTNSLPGSSGGGSAMRVMSVVTKCSGTGTGDREMELIFRFGVPMGDR